MSSKQCSILFLALFFIPLTARTEVLCHADVSYTWKKGGEGADLTQVLRTVEAVGATEELAKQQAGDSLLRERQRAVLSCRERHENMSGCVANRFSQSQTALSSMSFTARKALEDAIKTDCESLQGRCGDAVTGEIKCAERVAPAVVDTKSPAAGGTEKTEKGKAGEKEAKKK